MFVLHGHIHMKIHSTQNKQWIKFNNIQSSQSIQSKSGGQDFDWIQPKSVSPDFDRIDRIDWIDWIDWIDQFNQFT